MAREVLVTGADGMLGSHIVEILLQNGYRVKAMVLPGSPATNLTNLPVERCYGNILDENACVSAVQNCSMIIHTAAALHTWPTRSATLRAINITGTKNMVKAAIEQKVQRFVHISSASSFGPAAPGQIATEDSAFLGARYRLDYIDSKHTAQQYILEKARKEGFPAIVLCPTLMIGPKDVYLGTGKLLLALIKQQLPFLTGGGRNFVYVGDVAQAAVNALQQGTLGAAYLAGSTNLSYRQFFNLVGECAQVKPPKWLLPDWVILTFGYISTLLARVFHFSPLLNFSLARSSVDTQFYSSEKAIQELAMPQTDIRTAILAAMEWLKQEKLY